MTVTYLLPGIGGSTLAGPGGNPSPWPNSTAGIALSVATGRWSILQLNPDGTAPVPLSPGVVFGAYNRAGDVLSAIPLPYDWRRGPASAAAQVRPFIADAGWLVCHSYGGLVGLALLSKLVQEGRANLIEGIIFWMCPLDYARSNWTVHQGLLGRSKFAESLIASMAFGQLANGVRPGGNMAGLFSVGPTPGLVSLVTNPTLPRFQRMITSFDSIGALLPTDPAVRQLSYWQALGVQGVTQDWLDRGLAARNALAAQLASMPPFTRLWGVYHTGKDTPTGFGAGFLGTSYTTAPNGDSVVTANERPGGGPGSVPVLDGLTLIPGEHWASLQDTLTLESIRNVIVSATANAPKITPLPDQDGNRRLVHFKDEELPNGRVTGVFTMEPVDMAPGIMAGPFEPTIPPAEGPKPPVPFFNPIVPGAIQTDP